MIRGYIYIEAMRYAEWGVGKIFVRKNPSVACSDSSPFRGALIASNMPLLKGEVPAAQAVGFGIRRLRELQFMVPEVVKRMRGSKWLSAPPTGSRWVQAQPARPRNPCGAVDSSFKPRRILRL